jgi:diguanylate cyclase (GGDEF)-like protein
MAMPSSREPRTASTRAETGLVLACAVAVIAFAATVPLSLPHDLSVVAKSVGFFLSFGLAAAHLFFRAAKGRASDQGWAWIGGALLIFAAANVWAMLDVMYDLPQTVPPAADVLWFVAFPLLIGGVARLVRARVPQRGRAAFIDAMLVATGFFAIGATWLSIVLSRAPITASDYTVAFGTIDLFGILFVLGITLGAAQASNWNPPRSIWLLLAAAIIFSITDAVYAVQIDHGNYAAGGWLDLGWPLSAFAFSLAAHSRSNGRAAGRSKATAAEPIHSVVPSAMILAAIFVLLLPVPGPLSTIAQLSAITAILLSVLRMDRAVRSALALAEQLRIARIDPLTGLPNRRALRALLPDGPTGGVFVAFDLDGLGEVNATFGTSVGDRVLLLVASRISSSVRDVDIVARVGGDEFGVLLRNVDYVAAARIAESLVTKLEAEMSAEGHSLRISACAGVSSQATETCDIDQLITEAENALREAKRIGTGLVRTFSGITGERSQRRLRLRAEIKDVFRRGGSEFVPYFQPITSVRDGSILAVEALVRWHHDGEVLAPGEFLPEVEMSGSMANLTRHMLHSALAELRSAGLDCPVTVNMPPDLVDENLPAFVREVVAATKSTPDQCIIEITEDAIMRDPAMAAIVLGELRSEGFRVLLDDFGTGWSGLSSLRDLVVDGLKMDGSFIERMTSDDTTARIVRAVANLAEELGVLVIYEGVEDMRIVTEFEAAASGYIQGFALARPMPIGDLAAWVDRRTG